MREFQDDINVLNRSMYIYHDDRAPKIYDREKGEESENTILVTRIYCRGIDRIVFYFENIFNNKIRISITHEEYCL